MRFIVVQGDSGTGLSISQKFKDKTVYYLQGIVSNGKSNINGCDLGFFTMFTNIQEYSKMIIDALGNYPAE